MPFAGTALGFDFGRARIGVAAGNSVSMSAEPRQIILAKTNEQKWAGVARAVSEWQPDVLVVGVPRHPDGAPHEMTQGALRFARQCAGRFKKPVYVVDERYSSAVLESGREKIDDGSAAIILQQWFDEGCPERLP